jgi:hypothetical protein
MKKNVTKPRFADNGVYPFVKKLDYLNKKNDKDQHVLPKFAKLTFLGREIHHKTGTTKGVACTMNCRLNFDLPDYLDCEMFNNFYGGQHFNVTGVAYCGEDDTFDLEKGRLIAQAKAENEAYRVAKAMCTVAIEQLDNVVKALQRSISNFDKYIEHNKTFIENVADGKLKK